MLGKIWGLALVALAIYVAYQVATDPKFAEISKSGGKTTSAPVQSNGKDSGAEKEAKEDFELVAKSPTEIAEDLDDVCNQMQNELRDSKISPLFSSINLKFREKRLETKFLKEQLAQCFKKSDLSANTLELDIFSSDFAGENAAHQIQLQAGVFTKASKDKIYEVGRKFEIAKKAKKNPSLSTRVQK